MNRSLIHRGPDGEGVFSHGSCGLAHRRLSILDLSESATQPMQSPSGRFWITFNGEIHNYGELRADLTSRGFHFRTTGDTEVFLVAYECWGEESFRRFNGMWGAAIWDGERRRLILSRDRFGIKPLFYCCDPSVICFASEPKAILAALPHKTELDRERICSFLLGANPDAGEQTFYRHIKAVKPAHYLTIAAGGVKEESYWRLSSQAETACGGSSSGTGTPKATGPE